MTLMYYLHYPLWKVFFEELGFEFITSIPTNKVILDEGVKVTVTDACVPIKLIHGHVLELKDRVDYILIPRMVNADREKNITFCPKFLGLPDMIRASIPDLPSIIDARVDRKSGRFYLFNACKGIGEQFDKPFMTILRAYRKAVSALKKFENLMEEKLLLPQEGIEVLFNDSPPETESPGDLNIAVLGYPYQVYDTYISADIVGNLRKMGVRVWSMEMVPYSTLKKYAGKLKKKLFWHLSNRVIWANYHYLNQPQIDGVIHVSAFACGPDAMVDKIMELECKQRNFPFLNITVDEHTGEGGVLTRLEAFLDMIRLRRGGA
ncbi:MAG: 2-hydroxyglutaryl-CoA dehydratase [Clostridia bacterium]|nr:2-hydroxyglutaryl-CoA dehydratase [Clostridia bacterium]